MIFRAAELFLLCRSGAYQAEEKWLMPSANLPGLAAFFDAIVFYERLPISDYGVTFPEAPEIGAGASCNLVPIMTAEQKVLALVRWRRQHKCRLSSYPR